MTVLSSLLGLEMFRAQYPPLLAEFPQSLELDAAHNSDTTCATAGVQMRAGVSVAFCSTGVLKYSSLAPQVFLDFT